ncbi:MAG: DNA polymerase III subunit delta' [Chloroflexota bacterium]
MWQIIGQNRAVSLLQQSLEAGTLAHAYLLVGPTHVGKMTLAVSLAQALNCETGERPCLECPSCLKIASGGHADVSVIGLERNEDAAEAKLIHIDQIKEVQHSASLPPFEGNSKVFIIDWAELLSIDAANCLLKTLEEPPEKVVFILLTNNDRLLPSTVVSRCQRVEMPPLPFSEVEAALTERGIEAERAGLLARLSRGCPGWAISAAGDESWFSRRDDELEKMLGAVSGGYEERFEYAARLATQFGQSRRLVYDVLDFWLDYWRDLMLVKTGCAGMITNIDRESGLAAMAGGYRLAQIKNSIESIRAAAVQLRKNVNPRLALEVLMLDIPVKEGGNRANQDIRTPVRNG